MAEQSFRHKLNSVVGNNTYGTVEDGAGHTWPNATYFDKVVKFVDGEFSEGEDLVLVAKPKTGKVFVGWSGTNVGDATIDGLNCTVAKEVRKAVTLTATFAEAVTITLEYDANGGEPAPGTETESKTVGKNTNAVFTLADAPTPPVGYEFDGWEVTLPGSYVRKYAAGATMTVTASETATCTAVASYSELPGHDIATYAKHDGEDVFKSITVTPESGNAQAAGNSGWLPGTAITADAAEKLYDVRGYEYLQFSAWTATGVSVDDPSSHFIRFNMPSDDVTLTANYVLKNLDVRAKVDDASAGKVTASRTLTRGGETVQDNARYGDVATFSASGIPPGYSFAGWYTAGGARISSSTTYTTTLVDDLVLYAKVSVRVSFRWTSATPYVSHGPLTLNGQKFLNGEASADLPVGSTVEIKAELEDDGEFMGFTKDDEPISFTSPSERVYVAQTTVPSAAAQIVAGWAEEVESYYVALYAQNGSGNYTSDGAFELTGKNVEEIAKSVYESSMSTKHSTTVTAQSELGKFYKVTGAQIVRIRAYAMGALPFKRFDWDEWRQGGGLQSITPPLSSSPDYDNNFSVAGDYVGIGVFKEGATVKVRIRHEDESRVATGSLQLDGAKSYEYAQNGYYAKGEFDEDASVTIMARPANGYKFGGWFVVDSADGVVLPGAEPVSTSALWTFPAPTTDKSYVARFEEDSVGILLWEGSDENMEMEWTSKVYVAPKPFDPVAARVDATGYPVSLDVGTMSSPNATPTRPHPIEVASQDGRRLPRMRPERFVRFTVKASCEIDAVVIGTNMAEVN